MFEIQPDPTTTELSAIERLKKSPYAYNGKNGVATFSGLFLIGSISYLQGTMKYIRAWMSLKFCKLRLLVSMAKERVVMEKTGVAILLDCFLFKVLLCNLSSFSQILFKFSPLLNH